MPVTLDNISSQAVELLKAMDEGKYEVGNDVIKYFSNRITSTTVAAEEESKENTSQIYTIVKVTSKLSQSQLA